MKLATSIALCLLLGSCAAIVDHPVAELIAPAPVAARPKARFVPPPEAHAVVQKKQVAPTARPIGASSVACTLDEVIKCTQE